MELINVTQNTYPTLSTQSDIEGMVSRLNFTILQSGEVVKDFIVLNYESIINSMDISERSKETYHSNGKSFLDFIQSNDFNIDVYRNFKANLLRLKDLSIEAKKQKLITAKAILKNLHGHRRILTIDLTEGTKGIKTETGHKKDGLDNSEVVAVKNYIDSISDSRRRTRLKCMFSLLTLQGLRQFEMCNALIEDFNPNDGILKVIGKGNQDKKIIDLHPLSIIAINDYLTATGKKSGYFFTSEKGTTKGERLTERGFRKIFDAVFDASHVDRTAHGFRHFFVTTMLEATNGNTGIVMKFSRHKSVQALMMYDDRRLKKEHNETYYKAFAGI